MPKKTVLIVDDNPDNLAVLGDLLSGTYDVLAANSGARALQLARQHPAPDIVLLDVMMPGMNGHEVLRRLRQDAATQGLPVIFTTAMTADEDERTGLDLGAVDYLTKPLRPQAVLARVKGQLERKAAREALHRDNVDLAVKVADTRREKQVTEEVSLRALSSLAETRDNETGQHILRTQAYVAELAGLASRHPDYAPSLSARDIMLIASSAPLHDLGKVGIPDGILRKPGKLDAQEWEVMKTHAALGAQTILRALDGVDGEVDFLTYAAQIARHHHERWDGRGYPDGLAGAAIPLAARLMAIADVFDALISKRVYKPAMSFGEARDVMSTEGGKHFDPVLLELFLQHFDEFCAIAKRHPDTVPEHAAAH